MEGKNGRLRHYDGIRRLKATYVIVTWVYAWRLGGACQPAIETAQCRCGREGLYLPDRAVWPPDHGGQAVGPATGVPKWITLAETGSGYGVDGTSSVLGAGP